MDAHTVEVTIKVYLKQMRERLEKAASIAKAAETCADAGNVEKGIEIALDVGYASPSHFAQVFRRVVGVTPTEFRSAL